MKRVLILTISAVAALSLYSCKDFQKPGKDAETTEDVVVADTVEAVQHPVKTMLVANTTIQRTIKLTATMVAEEETYLAPGIAGKIRDIKVDINDRVKRISFLFKWTRPSFLKPGFSMQV